MRMFFLSTLLCGAMFAQVGGPLIGYVPYGSTIRPMYGLPAAGVIGEEIAEGGWAGIAISPAQNFVIASSAATGEVLLVNLVKPSVTSISGAASNPDILAISPHGTAAALWFPLSGQLQTITGLPNSPSIRTIDASFLNASPLAVAISDDGQWAAGLWSAGVYAFGPNSAVIPLQTDPGIVALAFFHNAHDLALATATRASKIVDLGGAMQSSVLYDYSSQPLSPRAIALSFDNSLAVIADSAGQLLNIGVASATTNIVDCRCSPTGLYGLGSALFRLNGTSSGGRGGRASDLKLFDASAGAVLIVPPALNQSGGRRP
jgi:DNA-binding beta-propeller fold protein YncE